MERFFLLKKNDVNTIYAMKILKKDQMKKKNQIEHVKTERRILVNKMKILYNFFIFYLKKIGNY